MDEQSADAVGLVFQNRICQGNGMGFATKVTVNREFSYGQ